MRADGWLPHLQSAYSLRPNDVLVFSKADDGKLIISGRKGTKADLDKKKAARYAVNGTDMIYKPPLDMRPSCLRNML